MYAWWEKKVVVGEGKQEWVWHSLERFLALSCFNCDPQAGSK